MFVDAHRYEGVIRIIGPYGREMFGDLAVFETIALQARELSFGRRSAREGVCIGAYVDVYVGAAFAKPLEAQVCADA